MPTRDDTLRPDFVALIPVYEDWAAVASLLEELDRVLEGDGRRASVLLVDDGSETGPSTHSGADSYRALTSVRILRLRRNLGHQRAICVGLSHLQAESEAPLVVVMDGDGEDAPADVPRLLDRAAAEGGERIVFAERSRRSEGAAFTLAYSLFRLLHWLLTGRRIRVGNFSVVPRSRLEGLVAVPDLWNHYAAAVVASRQPWTTVPTDRAKRLAGRGRMGWTGLVVHGLSAISVHADLVGVRLLFAAGGVLVLTTLAVGAVVVVRLFTDLAVPGWATYTTGLLVVILLQTVTFALLFSFAVLGNRRGAAVLPMRDFHHFVAGVEPVDGRLAPAEGAAVAASRS